MRYSLFVVFLLAGCAGTPDRVTVHDAGFCGQGFLTEQKTCLISQGPAIPSHDQSPEQRRKRLEAMCDANEQCDH